MSHTPGEWTADLTGRGIFDDNGQRIANVYTVIQILDSPEPVREIRTAERDANASLMAAAPKLLAACESLIEMYVKLGMDTPSMPTFEKTTVEFARAAIAKAKGQS